MSNLKEFTGTDIALMGEDEWQMSDLIIEYVESFEKRHVYLSDDTTSDSDYIVCRQMVSAPIFELSGTRSMVYDSDGNVVGKSSQEESLEAQEMSETTGFNQLFTANASFSISFSTQDVNAVSVMDYSAVRYSMSLEQAKQDWGFAKKRKTYDVSVQVADDDSYDTGNGDAGSANHFYFQLIFKNGESGYCLANQQISSDAFRSGKTEVFTIPTNRNYGEVVGGADHPGGDLYGQRPVR